MFKKNKYKKLDARCVKENISKNTILSKHVFLNMDTKQTGLNNNVCAIGAAGTGKSRFFIEPNLLQANCSYVVNDPYGELFETTGKVLKEKGYDVKVLNLRNIEKSNHYNPFSYVKNDKDIENMVDCLIKATMPKGKTFEDPFWEQSEKCLLSAISKYVYYECLQEERTFESVIKILRAAIDNAENTENIATEELILDKLFGKIEERDGASNSAVKNYKVFKMASGKQINRVMLGCFTRLISLNFENANRIISTDTVELDKISERKTVLYIINSDDTYSFLASLMYSQILSILYSNSKNNINHVRFVFDGFADIGQIPGFENYVATMKQHNMSYIIALHNLAQLKNIYKEKSNCIIDNCDTMLFFGSPNLDVCDYFSKLINKKPVSIHSIKGRKHILTTPDELRKMYYDYCIGIIREQEPFFDKKYDVVNHPNYTDSKISE